MDDRELVTAAANFLETYDEYNRVLGDPATDSGDEDSAERDLGRARALLERALEAPAHPPTPPDAAARGDGGRVVLTRRHPLDGHAMTAYVKWRQGFESIGGNIGDVLPVEPFLAGWDAALRAPTTTPAHPGGAETAAEGGM